MRSHESYIDDDYQEVLERSAIQSQLRIYIEQLIKESQTERNPKAMGRLYYSIAFAHEELELLFEAETYFRAAAYSFGEFGESAAAAKAWLEAGRIRAYVSIFDVEDALRQAKRAAESANNAYLQAEALHALGRLKQANADFEGALADYELALHLVSGHEDSDALILRDDILEGMGAVQLESLLVKAKELAERTNRNAETPPTAPGDPTDLPPSRMPMPFPSRVIRSTQGSQSIWPRKRRGDQRRRR